jgi:hypothetical protein
VYAPIIDAQPVLLRRRVTRRTDIRRLASLNLLLVGALQLPALCAGQASATGTASFVGSVERDSLGHESAGAQIYFPALRIGVTANYVGQFRLMQLPAGSFLVEVRHIGYAIAYDTVELVAGRTTRRDFILSLQAVRLDSVRVTDRAPEWRSPGLRAFEERRRLAIGSFISSEQLRKEDDRDFDQVLRRNISGLRIVTELSSAWAASNQPTGISNGLRRAPRRSIQDPTSMSMPSVDACWASVFVDGVRIYDRGSDKDTPPPDLSRLHTRDYDGVEFYSGGASVPVEYNTTGGGCGVLLLWTRER